jgi:hypothetical protein
VAIGGLRFKTSMGKVSETSWSSSTCLESQLCRRQIKEDFGPRMALGESSRPYLKNKWSKKDGFGSSDRVLA